MYEAAGWRACFGCGGLYRAFENAEVIGARTVQFFGASPRQWFSPLPTAESIKQFELARKDSNVQTFFLHAPYLPNIANPDKDARIKSINALTGHLTIVRLLKSNGLIFHIGSSKPLPREDAVDVIVESMHEILKNVPGDTHLIIENSAGGDSGSGRHLRRSGRSSRA